MTLPVLNLRPTLRMDPTRTTTLRARYMADMRRRFAAVRRLMVEAVVAQDAWGLKEHQPLTFHQAPEKEAFRFLAKEDKVKSFNKWFGEQVDNEILKPTTVTGAPWTSKYVDSAYKQGSLRAYTDSHSEAMGEKLDFYKGRREEFLQSAFNQPERLSKLRLLATRSYEDLKGITAHMSQQVGRIMADGISHGLSPSVIARTLSNEINKITRTRALVMARTEIINAHSEGQLDSFEDLGVKEIGVMAEWSTAGDDRVCPECGALEGVVMTVAEARGLIPRHPNCRCAWIPANVGEIQKRKKRLWTKIGKKQMVDDSLMARLPKRTRAGKKVPQTIEEAKRRSTWPGKHLEPVHPPKGVDLSGTAPKPISKPISKAKPKVAAPKPKAPPKAPAAPPKPDPVAGQIQMLERNLKFSRSQVAKAKKGSLPYKTWSDILKGQERTLAQLQKAGGVPLPAPKPKPIPKPKISKETQALLDKMKAEHPGIPKRTIKRTLLKEEEDALDFWTRDGYKAIREKQGAAINDIGLTEDMRKLAPKAIERIDSAFIKMPKYSGKGYRGMSLELDEAEIAQMFKKGSTIHDKGYTSWSTKSKKADEFMEATSRHGRKVKIVLDDFKGRGADIGQYSRLGEEAEVLMRANTSLRVKSAKRVGDIFEVRVEVVEPKPIPKPKPKPKPKAPKPKAPKKEPEVKWYETPEYKAQEAAEKAELAKIPAKPQGSFKPSKAKAMSDKQAVELRRVQDAAQSKEIRAAEKWLAEHDEAADMMKEWSGVHYENVRAAQTGGVPNHFTKELWAKEKPKWVKRAKEMDKMYAKAPKVKQPIYRGMRIEQDVLDRMIEGEVWSEGSYSSYTMDRATGEYFASGMDSSLKGGLSATRKRVLINVRNGEGVDITSVSKFADEKEVLVQTSKKMKVVRADKRMVYSELDDEDVEIIELIVDFVK